MRNRNAYPPDWRAISKRIRFERAGGRCEKCGAVHGQPHPITGSKTVLQVHHLGIEKPDGSPGDKNDKLDCRDENLAALCQACHLDADRADAVKKSARTKTKNTHRRIVAAGQLDLFVEETIDETH